MKQLIDACCDNLPLPGLDKDFCSEKDKARDGTATKERVSFPKRLSVTTQRVLIKLRIS